MKLIEAQCPRGCKFLKEANDPTLCKCAPLTIHRPKGFYFYNAVRGKGDVMDMFYRYIRRHEIYSVWASGFKLIELRKPHGLYAVLGEFRCARSA